MARGRRRDFDPPPGRPGYKDLLLHHRGVPGRCNAREGAAAAGAPRPPRTGYQGSGAQAARERKAPPSTDKARGAHVAGERQGAHRPWVGPLLRFPRVSAHMSYFCFGARHRSYFRFGRRVILSFCNTHLLLLTKSDLLFESGDF